MEDKIISSSIDIKSKMDDLFIFASQIKYSKDHPLRIIHACKSLIGINPDNPPYNILKWLEAYLNNYEPNFFIKSCI